MVYILLYASETLLVVSRRLLAVWSLKTHTVICIFFYTENHCSVSESRWLSYPCTTQLHYVFGHSWNIGSRSCKDLPDRRRISRFNIIVCPQPWKPFCPLMSGGRKQRIATWLWQESPWKGLRTPLGFVGHTLRVSTLGRLTSFKDLAKCCL